MTGATLSKATAWAVVVVMVVAMATFGAEQLSRRAANPATTSGVVIAATSTSTSVATLATFTSSVSSIDAPTRALMTGRSWRSGCPVTLKDLRVIAASYFGFDRRSHLGHLVVNADVATPVVRALRTLYAAHFRIRQMRLVDYFGGSDEKSMTNDNTSAFNCRIVPGSAVWSQHAYGRALDVNPLENPEIQNGVVDPPSATPWADRSHPRVGMIFHGGVAWRAFAAIRWKWGGDWTSPKDYQHFSANGL